MSEMNWHQLIIFQNSLLGLEPINVNKMALECFACVMRYMGDMPLLKNQHEVDCVNTIFLYCRQFEPIRDEVYCQIMKQTTNNKSMNPVSLIEWLIYRIIIFQFIIFHFLCIDENIFMIFRILVNVVGACSVSLQPNSQVLSCWNLICSSILKHQPMTNEEHIMARLWFACIIFEKHSSMEDVETYHPLRRSQLLQPDVIPNDKFIGT